MHDQAYLTQASQLLFCTGNITLADVMFRLSRKFLLGPAKTPGAPWEGVCTINFTTRAMWEPIRVEELISCFSLA